jgi:hypothetical protein
MDDTIKQQARRLKAAIQKHGTVCAYLDDVGTVHALPGYDAALLGVYDGRITMADLIEDLQHKDRA